jgi:hypothetical protein
MFFRFLCCVVECFYVRLLSLPVVVLIRCPLKSYYCYFAVLSLSVVVLIRCLFCCSFIVSCRIDSMPLEVLLLLFCCSFIVSCRIDSMPILLFFHCQLSYWFDAYFAVLSLSVVVLIRCPLKSCYCYFAVTSNCLLLRLLMITWTHDVCVDTILSKIFVSTDW